MADSTLHATDRRKGWSSLLPLVGPLVLFGLVGWLVLSSSDRSEPAAMDQQKLPPITPPTKPDWQVVDWSGVESVRQLPGWMLEQGAFQFRADASLGEKVLEQLPEPMTEGLLRSWTRFSFGGVRTRMSGEAHRRTAPRFSVGLEGRRAFHLRAAPSHRRLELVTPPEVMLGEAPWEWQKDRSLWLELLCLPGEGGGIRLEARAWAEGEPRPTEPQIVRQEKDTAGRLSPSVRGGPFALKPIVTERLLVLKLD